jgi:hypothetical protein
VYENDPILQEILDKNELSFDDLDKLDPHDYQDIWDTLMTTTETDIQIEEDFGMAEERFVDFETFITENE